MRIDNFYSNEKILDMLENIMTTKHLPHLLLSGKNGSGKTYLINKVINNMNIEPHKIINVDLYGFDKKNIKKSKLFLFLNKVSSSNGVVIIDNYNNINLDHQYIIRSLIKNYCSNKTFIISTNSIDNIIQPLRQYFIHLEICLPTKNELREYLKNNLKLILTRSQEDIVLENITNYCQCNMMIKKIHLYLLNNDNINTKDLKIFTNNNIHIIKRLSSYIKNKNYKLLIKYLDEIFLNYTYEEIILLMTNHCKIFGNLISVEKNILLDLFYKYKINNIYTYTQIITLFIEIINLI